MSQLRAFDKPCKAERQNRFFSVACAESGSKLMGKFQLFTSEVQKFLVSFIARWIHQVRVKVKHVMFLLKNLYSSNVFRYLITQCWMYSCYLAYFFFPFSRFHFLDVFFECRLVPFSDDEPSPCLPGKRFSLRFFLFLNNDFLYFFESP